MHGEHDKRFVPTHSIVGGEKIYPTLIAVILVAAVGIFSQNIFKHLPENSKDRIDIFINPEKDPLKKGYNVMQSVLAVGSGGITGKGFLQGTQTQLRYIPEQRTDFIFCVTAEEFGFIGSAIVILFMTGLIYRAMKIAAETDSLFYSIVAF